MTKKRWYDKRITFYRRNYKMFKQYRIIVTLVIIGLVGGVYGTQVDASASAGNANQGNQVEQKVNKESYEQRWEAFIQNCFGQWQSEKTNEKQQEQQPTESTEEKEVEEVTQPQGSEEESNSTEEQAQEQEQAEETSDDEGENTLHPFEQEVFELTNAEREKNGLEPLQIDTEVSKVARDKSQDMLDNQYFAHDSPTYGSPFAMMSAYGVDYRTAGENIAKGQQSAEEVVNAWMDSPGHRENILNDSFTHIGVGYVEQDNIWTQQFIGK